MRAANLLLAVVALAGAARAARADDLACDPFEFVARAADDWTEDDPERQCEAVARLLAVLDREDVDVRGAIDDVLRHYERVLARALTTRDHHAELRALLRALADHPRGETAPPRGVLELARLCHARPDEDAGARIIREARVLSAVMAEPGEPDALIAALSVLAPQDPVLARLRARWRRSGRALEAAVKAHDGLGLPDPVACALELDWSAEGPPVIRRRGGCRCGCGGGGGGGGGGVLSFDDEQEDHVRGWAIRDVGGAWRVVLDDLRVATWEAAPFADDPSITEPRAALHDLAGQLARALGPGALDVGEVRGCVEAIVRQREEALEDETPPAGVLRFDDDDDDDDDRVPAFLPGATIERAVLTRALAECEGCPGHDCPCDGGGSIHVDAAAELWRTSRRAGRWVALRRLEQLAAEHERSPARVVADSLAARARAIERSIGLPGAEPLEQVQARAARARDLLERAAGLGAGFHGADCPLELHALRSRIASRVALLEGVACSPPPRPLPTWEAWQALGPEARMEHVVERLLPLPLDRGDMALEGAPEGAPSTARGHVEELGWDAVPALIDLLGEGWPTIEEGELEPAAAVAARWLQGVVGASIVGEPDLSDPVVRNAVRHELRGWWATWGPRGPVAFHLDGVARSDGGQGEHAAWLVQQGAALPTLRALYLGLAPQERADLLPYLASSPAVLSDDDLRREAATDPELTGELTRQALWQLAARGDPWSVTRAQELGTDLREVMRRATPALLFSLLVAEEPEVRIGALWGLLGQGVRELAPRLLAELREAPALRRTPTAEVDLALALLPGEFVSLLEARDPAIALRAANALIDAGRPEDARRGLARLAAALRRGDEDARPAFALIAAQLPDALPGALAGAGHLLPAPQVEQLLSPARTPALRLAALVAHVRCTWFGAPALLARAVRLSSPRSAQEELDVFAAVLRDPAVRALALGDALVLRALADLAGQLRDDLLGAGAARRLGLLDGLCRQGRAPRVLGPLVPVVRDALRAWRRARPASVCAVRVHPALLPVLALDDDAWRGQPLRARAIVALVERWEAGDAPGLQVVVERVGRRIELTVEPWTEPQPSASAQPGSARPTDWRMSIDVEGGGVQRRALCAGTRPGSYRMEDLLVGVEALFGGFADDVVRARLVIRALRPR